MKMDSFLSLFGLSRRDLRSLLIPHICLFFHCSIKFNRQPNQAKMRFELYIIFIRQWRLLRECDTGSRKVAKPLTNGKSPSRIYSLGDNACAFMQMMQNACATLTQQQLQPGDVSWSSAQQTTGAHRSGPSSDFAASAPQVCLPRAKLRHGQPPSPSRYRAATVEAANAKWFAALALAYFGEGDLHANLHFALHPNELEASADPAGHE